MLLLNSSWRKKGVEHFLRLYFKPHAMFDSMNNNVAEIFMASLQVSDIISTPKTIFKSAMKRIAAKKKKNGQHL